MLHIFRKLSATAIASAVLLTTALPVQAGWWHHNNGCGSSGGSPAWGGGWSGGSSGWSGGSSGYAGGSSGGYAGGSSGWSGGSSGYADGGSSGGGLFSRWHHRHKAAYGGSSGWSGGSSGGYSYHGGSSGGFSGGSSGGWGYSTPATSYDVYDAPTPSVQPAPVAPMGEAPAAPMTSNRRHDGVLLVAVPNDAKIYVNDRATTTPGSTREYVSRNLNPGFNYTYEVRAEIVRNGKTIVETKKIDLRAGETSRLDFGFEAADTVPVSAEVETVLKLTVPENAKVSLGGNMTDLTGTEREFRTTALAAGTAWDDYKVVVTYEVDGRTLTKEQTISLKAGQNADIKFDFNANSVADAR